MLKASCMLKLFFVKVTDHKVPKQHQAGACVTLSDTVQESFR